MKNSLFLLLFFLPAFIQSSLNAQNDDPDARLPQVLIIGDSISIAYSPFVVQDLDGIAEVTHHKGNAGPTLRGVENLDQWLGDVHYVDEGNQQLGEQVAIQVRSALEGTVQTDVAEQINSVPDSSSLPDPDGKPANMNKPVKVFILLGQSNMLGFGKLDPEDKQGTLNYLIKREHKYPHLVDDAGEWTVRNDVRYVQVMHRNGNMSTLRNEWMTVKGNIGPELQFGHIMGNKLEEPVLVIKSCIGNRSLGWDLLPPGSESFEFEGKIFAGYKQSPLSWDKGSEPEPIDWYAGKQYDDDIANVKTVLANISEYYPGAKNYEVAGFVWWQGHKDQNAAHASRYEQNLVHLIKTLRKDFDAPQAKFVLATIGFEGDQLSGHGLTVANAQLAVSGETGKYPEFSGNVKTIDARPFWKDKSVSPSGAGHHYNLNAETYMEVGNSLGWAMQN